MTERKYLPRHYMDEVIPEPRTSATAWITRLDDGAYALAPMDPYDEGDAPPGQRLVIGDVVEFYWNEVFPSIEVEILADGSFRASSEPEVGATHFWVPIDTDTMADTLSECVAGLVAAGYQPGTVEIGQYAWSEQVERYRFDLGSDGPRFVLEETRQ